MVAKRLFSRPWQRAPVGAQLVTWRLPTSSEEKYGILKTKRKPGSISGGGGEGLLTKVPTANKEEEADRFTYRRQWLQDPAKFFLLAAV